MNWLKSSEIGTFLLKVLGIYFCWYFIYELWLLPAGTVDGWLTQNLISVSAGLLNILDFDFYAADRLIGLDKTPGIYLANGCSGIAATGLFIGFVIAYPGDWIPRILFLLTGIGIIYLVNICRIITLTLTQSYWPDIFEVTHSYSTTAIFYIVIFVLWMVWANFGTIRPKLTTCHAKN